MEIITSWQTLMKFAKELGDARVSGDKERIAVAQKKHDDYRDACLQSDKMNLGMTVGHMHDRGR